MAEAHPVGFQWVEEARRRGAVVVHVDPRCTRTSAQADRHIPIRAGSDIALLGGLINHVLTNDLWFSEYVVAYTNASTIVDGRFRDTEDLDGLFSGFDPDAAAYDLSSWAYAAPDPGEPGREAHTGRALLDAQTQDVHRPFGLTDERDQIHGGVGGVEQQQLRPQSDAEHVGDASRTAGEPEAALDGGLAGAASAGETHGQGGPQLGQARVRTDPTLTDPFCVFQLVKRHYARYTPEVIERTCVGDEAIVAGDAANDLLGLALDPNVNIQESKVGSCDIVPGRRPRGSAVVELVDEYRRKAGLG